MCTSHDYLLPDNDGTSPLRGTHVGAVMQGFAVVAVFDAILVALFLLR